MTRRLFRGMTPAIMGTSMLLLMASGLVGGLSASLAAAQPKPGGTLTVGLAADIAHFDVFHAIGYEAIWALGNLHSGLVRADPSGKIVPDMATSWDIKDEGLTYVFRLQKGITFHDGTPADAEAIKWNMEYILDPVNKADAQVFFKPIASVEALDDATLQVRLQAPSADFLMVLGGYRTGFLVASPTAVKQWGKDYKFHPVGSGPFKFVEWTPGQQATLAKHESYFKPGLPYLDKVILKTMKEATTRIGAVRSGELAFATWIPLEMVRLLEGAPGVKVVTGPIYNVWDLRPNVKSKPFDDLRVRKALLGYGIDRKEIVKVAFGGHGQASVTMFTPGMPGYTSLMEMYPYDPRKARALLQEAGYSPSNPLTLTILSPTIEPAFTNVPTLLKDQLARIGVQLKIEMLDKVTWMDRFVRKHDFQLTLGNVTGFDIGAFAPYFETTSSMNFASHTDTRVDELLQRWRTTTNPTEHAKATEELQTYLADKLYQIGYANTPFYHGVREYVKGYTFVDKLHLNFETAWLDR
ncbi:MAG: ABC transporter substrate-binding protein [Nitrospinae bacterium]|nr:ABC transporter substrate-binding protein [Nitrospinota bacterium]